jgi:hypothetical protein
MADWLNKWMDGWMDGWMGGWMDQMCVHGYVVTDLLRLGKYIAAKKKNGIIY